MTYSLYVPDFPFELFVLCLVFGIFSASGDADAKMFLLLSSRGWLCGRAWRGRMSGHDGGTKKKAKQLDSWQVQAYSGIFFILDLALSPTPTFLIRSTTTTTSTILQGTRGQFVLWKIRTFCVGMIITLLVSPGRH